MYTYRESSETLEPLVSWGYGVLEHVSMLQITRLYREIQCLLVRSSQFLRVHSLYHLLCTFVSSFPLDSSFCSILSLRFFEQ